MRIHGAAEAEVEAAFDWYLERDPGIAAAFLDQVRACIDRAARFPRSGALLVGYPPAFEVRAYRLARFPYSVVVALDHGEQVVVAVAHHRQRPGYWGARVAP